MCEVCTNGSPARAEERILWHEQSWTFQRPAHKGVDMNCLRGAGLMVRDDLQDETGLERLAAWRCLICGEVLDPVILENRSAVPNLMVERGRHWPKVQCVSTGNT